MKILEIYNKILESSKDDIFMNKEGKKIYQKILKNIDSIQFKPTDTNDWVKDSRGRVHLLYGVKFSLNQIDKKYESDICLVNTIGSYAAPFFDKTNNRFVFFIITQNQDKTDFESNLRLAKIRFKSWITEDVFVHEFIHYLDSNRYKDTYQFINPENSENYYNSPEEYNAFSHEIINKILKNKNSLIKLDFNTFLNKVLKYGSQEFFKSLSDDNKKKLKNRLYKLYTELNNKINLTENIKLAKFLYHKSNPLHRKIIDKEGLLPQRGEQWLDNTDIKGKAVFVTNSENQKDWFNSTYDDDIWQIDSSKIPNIKWKLDPNHGNSKQLYTQQPIPRNAITLIKKGTGKSLI